MWILSTSNYLPRCYYPAIEEKSLLSSMCNGIRRKKVNKKKSSYQIIMPWNRVKRSDKITDKKEKESGLERWKSG